VNASLGQGTNCFRVDDVNASLGQGPNSVRVADQNTSLGQRTNCVRAADVNASLGQVTICVRATNVDASLGQGTSCVRDADVNASLGQGTNLRTVTPPRISVLQTEMDRWHPKSSGAQWRPYRVLLAALRRRVARVHHGQAVLLPEGGCRPPQQPPRGFAPRGARRVRVPLRPRLAHRGAKALGGGSFRTCTQTVIGQARMTYMQGDCSYRRAAEEEEEEEEGRRFRRRRRRRRGR